MRPSGSRVLRVGAQVRVYFQAGFFGGRFYRTGWRRGEIVGLSSIANGTVRTYDVRLRDGYVITHCSATAIRPAGRKK